MRYAAEIEADPTKASVGFGDFVYWIEESDTARAVQDACVAWGDTDAPEDARAKAAGVLATALRAWAATPAAFEATLNEYVGAAHENAVDKGWWDGHPVSCEGLRPRREMTPDQVLAKLMLIVTEVAEAAEDVRNGDMDAIQVEGEKPAGFPTELADIVIRVFDLAGALGIDLQAEVARKMLHNYTRPPRHGGKLA